MHPGGCARLAARNLEVCGYRHSLAHGCDLRGYRQRDGSVLLGERAVRKDHRIAGLPNRHFALKASVFVQELVAPAVY